MVQKILILSDIHNQIITLENILRKAEEIISQPFTTIIAGDITNFGTIENMTSILNLVSEFSSQIFFVFGNCDPFYDVDKLQTEFLHIEANPQLVEGITYVGFGSVTPQINHKILKKLKKRDERVCLLTHVPPYGTGADTVSLNKHVGSKEVRKILETYSNIFLSISGHIHDSPTISMIDDCYIINPGSVTQGNFASIEICDNYKIKGKLYNIHGL